MTILLLSFKERENMTPSCTFKSPVWEYFDFLVAIFFFFMFVVEKIDKFTLWVHVLHVKYKQYTVAWTEPK